MDVKNTANRPTGRDPNALKEKLRPLELHPVCSEEPGLLSPPWPYNRIDDDESPLTPVEWANNLHGSAVDSEQQERVLTGSDVKTNSYVRRESDYRRQLRHRTFSLDGGQESGIGSDSDSASGFYVDQPVGECSAEPSTRSYPVAETATSTRVHSLSESLLATLSSSLTAEQMTELLSYLPHVDSGSGFGYQHVTADSDCDRTLRPAECRRLIEQIGVSGLQFVNADDVLSFKLEDKYAELVVPPPPKTRSGSVGKDVSKVPSMPGEHATAGRSNSRKLPKIPVDQAVPGVAGCSDGGRIVADLPEASPLPVVNQLDNGTSTLKYCDRTSDQETLTDNEENLPTSKLHLEPELSLRTTNIYEGSQTEKKSANVKLITKRPQRSDDIPVTGTADDKVHYTSTFPRDQGRKARAAAVNSSSPTVDKVVDVSCLTLPDCNGSISSSRPAGIDDNNNRKVRDSNYNYGRPASDDVNHKPRRVDPAGEISAFTSYGPRYQPLPKSSSDLPTSQIAAVVKKANRRLTFNQKSETSSADYVNDVIGVTAAAVCHSPAPQPTVASVSSNVGASSVTSSKLADVLFSSPCHHRSSNSSTVDDRSTDSVFESAGGSCSSVSWSEDGVNSLGGDNDQEMTTQVIRTGTERVLQDHAQHQQAARTPLPHGSRRSFDVSDTTDKLQHQNQQRCHQQQGLEPVDHDYAQLLRQAQQKMTQQPRHNQAQNSGLVRCPTSAREQIGKQLPPLPPPSLSDRYRKPSGSDVNGRTVTGGLKVVNEQDARNRRLMRPSSVPVPEYQQQDLSSQPALNFDDQKQSKIDPVPRASASRSTRRISDGVNRYFSVSQQERCLNPSYSAAGNVTVTTAEIRKLSQSEAAKASNVPSGSTNTTTTNPEKKAPKGKHQFLQKGLSLNFNFISPKRKSSNAVESDGSQPTMHSVSRSFDHTTNRQPLPVCRQQSPSRRLEPVGSLPTEVIQMTSVVPLRPASAFQPPPGVTGSIPAAVARRDALSADRSRRSSESSRSAERRNQVTSVSSSVDVGTCSVTTAASDSGYCSMSLPRHMETSFTDGGSTSNAINGHQALVPQVGLRLIAAPSEDDQLDANRRRMPETPSRTPPPYCRPEVLTPLPTRKSNILAASMDSKPPSGTASSGKVSKSTSFMVKIRRILPTSRGKGAVKATAGARSAADGSSVGTIESQDDDGSRTSSLDRRSTVSFRTDVDNVVGREFSVESGEAAMDEPDVSNGGIGSTSNFSPVHQRHADDSRRRLRTSGLDKLEAILDTPSATPMKTPSGPLLSKRAGDDFSTEISQGLFNRWEKTIIEKTYEPSRRGRISAIIDVQVLIERMSDSDDVTAISASSNSLPDQRDQSESRDSSSPASYRVQVFDDAKTKLGSAARHFVAGCMQLIVAAKDAWKAGGVDSDGNFDAAINRTVKLYAVLLARFRYAAAIFGRHRGAQLATRMSEVSTAFQDTLESVVEFFDLLPSAEYDDEEKAESAKLILKKTDRLSEALTQLVSTTKCIKLIKREAQTPTAFF